MASSDISVGSFAYLTVGETDFLVKRLGVAPFDPNTADVGIHSCVFEIYAKKVIYGFNFSMGTKVVVLTVGMWRLFVLLVF